MIKGKMIHIRVTETEHKNIHHYAKGKNLNLSSFARKVLLNEKAGGSLIADELLKLRQELSRIGNNLNQLARLGNSGQAVDISKNLSELQALQNQLNKQLEKVR